MSKSNAQSSSKPDEQEIRDRAIRLFTFLREITQLRTKSIKTLDQYEKVLWFKDIPREPGCHCIAWESSQDQDEADGWLEIKKPRLKSPPKPSSELEPWLDIREIEDSSKEVPSLRERITVTVSNEESSESEEKTVFKELAGCPEIRPAYQRYVENDWNPWAEENRRLKPIQDVYADLFSIYQKQQHLGEAYEVVLGLGYLTWKTANEVEVKRHLITAQTSLAFDASRGVISVGPAGEGAKPTLEQDMLEPHELPAPKVQNAIEQQVESIGEALWDGVQTRTVLKTWVHEVSSQGQFDGSLSPPSILTSDPQIHLAPAIILRRRTERSLLRMFQEIIQQLRDGHSVPVGVMRLVTIMDDASDGSSDEHTEEITSSLTPSPLEEVYFPLPANAEQKEIVNKLSKRHGVLVQGPPGTGKSHTIANLVCHLLATGQRVLITSHASRALKALLDRFKTDVNLKEIADLCVILLNDDLDAMQGLEDSVQGISDRHNNWDSEKNERIIIDLERKLDEARRAEASSLTKLQAIREAETYIHPPQFGNYSGSAQCIAGRLKEEEHRYSWLMKSPEEEEMAPLSDQEATELLRYLREIDSEREQELNKELMDPNLLINPGEFVMLVKKEAETIALFEAAESLRNHHSYGPLAAISVETRNSFLAELSELLRTYDALSQHYQPWVKEAAIHILADRDRAWRELLTFTEEILNAIGAQAQRASRRQIDGLGKRNLHEVKAHSTALLRHLDQGGKLGFGYFRPKVVKESLYLIKEVLIDGSRCQDTHLLRYLIEWITVTDHLEMLRVRWSSHTQPPRGTFPSQVEEYKDLCEPLGKALELHSKVTTVKVIIASIKGLQEPIWYNSESLHVLVTVAKAVLLGEELTAARKPLELLEKHLADTAFDPNVHPVVKQMLGVVRSRDEKGYIEGFQSLSNLRKLRDELTKRNVLLRRLKIACPELASQLSMNPSEQVWDSRMVEFTSAWDWKKADRWLGIFNDPHAQQELMHTLEHHRTRIGQLVRNLAAAKAWGHCFKRLTERERQHLMAWKDAIRRVGKGTGRHAPMHRKAAREHMEQCRSAIPAWIMPIYRVAETIRPGQESFDVVIVDEASQSGPEAIFLQYLAKKIVVVGDDKQISPDFVGTMRDDVELLRQRYIQDIPLSDTFGLDTSFFGQAVIRFPGRIRLREHFRCMPEIIQFSNKLCYQAEPLIPLRQYGTGRLSPIVTKYVNDGYQKGHSPKVVNLPEAESIVKQIKICCEDSAYAGKSMGVISLLGDEQAKQIHKLLQNQIGEEEMKKRNLVCGNAYDFQGTERDIMFLSLVSAATNDAHIGTLASPADQRRFNVAASRARDQMWLFHTATLNDLSPKCMRYQLLAYCQNPTVESETVGDLHVEKLRALAKGVDRDRVPPPQPFDSWFEIDVCLMIIGRSYRVVPQFPIAGRRIDLMVEGMRGRLAVECDGDFWHGAEQYEADMHRERILTRCGLTFWRVSGSVFKRDPEKALESLWDTLNRLSIYPAGHPNAEDTVKPDTRQASAKGGTSHPARTTPFYERREAPKLFPASEPLFERSLNDSKEETVEDGAKDLPGNTNVSEEGNGEEAIHNESNIPLATFMQSYIKWASRPLPDPSSTPLDEVAKGLAEIVSAEGPMLCERAYHIYAKAAGIGRVGRQIRSVFNRAIRKAVKSGFLEEANEHQTNDQLNKIVRKTGAPAIILRSRGDRMFEEIPPAEIGSMILQLGKQNPGLEGEELLRSVLDHFGIKRMTSNIRTILLHAKERVEN